MAAATVAPQPEEQRPAEGGESSVRRVALLRVRNRSLRRLAGNTAGCRLALLLCHTCSALQISHLTWPLPVQGERSPRAERAEVAREPLPKPETAPAASRDAQPGAGKRVRASDSGRPNVRSSVGAEAEKPHAAKRSKNVVGATAASWSVYKPSQTRVKLLPLQIDKGHSIGSAHVLIVAQVHSMLPPCLPPAPWYPLNANRNGAS
eukprot:SAG11_NODE_3425_length_2455_cov_1.747453_1_plen_206_part_00